jgi:hypothetical protein
MAQELQCFWYCMQLQGIQQLTPPAKLKKTASPDSPPAAAATAAAAHSISTDAASLARSHPSIPLFIPSSSIPFAASTSSSSSSGSLSGPGAATQLCWEAAAHARLLVASRRSPATHPTPAVFRHAEQLQAIATKQREDFNRANLIARSSLRRKALLTATSVANSAAFLSTLPTVAAYTLDNESVIQAVRHRLGLSAADEIVPQVCVCGARFADDPDHYHSCVKLRSSSLTLRHNAIVNTLARLATEAGWLVTVEPNDHLRPAPAAAAAAAAAPLAPMDAAAADRVSCSDEPESEHWNRHGDLLLLRHNAKLYIDVSCTRPTNASSLSSQPAVAHTPLVSTAVRAKQKEAKYKAIAEANGYTLLPFVVETYGGMGKEALRVLQFLAAHSPDSKRAFLRHAHSSLSVVLQRGNALVALFGQQQLNVRRQREHKSMREAIRRCRHYGQLGSIQQQREWLDPDISAVHAAVAEDPSHSHSPSHAHSPSSLSHAPPLPFVHASLAFSAGANAVAALHSHSLSQLHSAAAAAPSVSG